MAQLDCARISAAMVMTRFGVSDVYVALSLIYKLDSYSIIDMYMYNVFWLKNGIANFDVDAMEYNSRWIVWKLCSVQ